MKTSDFTKHVSTFLTSYLTNERGCQKNTIQSYAVTLSLFWKFLTLQKGVNIKKLDMPDFRRQTVVDFLDWLENERKCSPSSRNARLAAIKSLFSYVGRIDVQYLSLANQIGLIGKKKFERKIPTFLTVEGIKLLLSIPDLSTIKGKRDMLLMALMYDSAARVQEIIDLTPASIVAFDKHLWVKIAGKGQKVRQVALNKDYKDYLMSYLCLHGLDKIENHNRPIFFGSRGAKLTRAGISHILKTYIIRAQQINSKVIPKNITCHSLRHSRAIHLLEADVHLMHIRDILGHESVTTTERYARLGTEFKEKAISKAYMDVTPNLNDRTATDDDWLASFLENFK